MFRIIYDITQMAFFIQRNCDRKRIKKLLKNKNRKFCKKIFVFHSTPIFLNSFQTVQHNLWISGTVPNNTPFSPHGKIDKSTKSPYFFFTPAYGGILCGSG